MVRPACRRRLEAAAQLRASAAAAISCALPSASLCCPMGPLHHLHLPRTTLPQRAAHLRHRQLQCWGSLHHTHGHLQMHPGTACFGPLLCCCRAASLHAAQRFGLAAVLPLHAVRACVTRAASRPCSLQGLALGGEFGAATVYVSEMAGVERRGLMTAILQVSRSAAALGANLRLLLCAPSRKVVH